MSFRSSVASSSAAAETIGILRSSLMVWRAATSGVGKTVGRISTTNSSRSWEELRVENRIPRMGMLSKIGTPDRF